jgi:hypothetical protein
MEVIVPIEFLSMSGSESDATIAGAVKIRELRVM